MNLIFCNKLDNYSGWGTLARNYIKFFSMKNTIIFCHKKNPLISIKQYEVLRDPLAYIKNPLLVIWDLKKINKILGFYDKSFLINTHYLVEPYFLFDFFFKKKFNKRVFYLIGTYSNYFFSSIKWKFFFKKLFDDKCFFIFLSSYIKKILRNNIKFDAKNCFIINPYLNDENNLKKKITNKSLKILSVGAYKKRKGYLELIKTIKEIIQKNKVKNIYLTIVGSINDKKYFNKLLNYVEENNLENKITLKVNLNDQKLNNEYNKCNLFILNSIYSKFHLEGYGIVYLEALKNNCDIFVSKFSGAIDLQKYFTNKIIFNSMSKNDLKKKILSYMKYKKNKFVKINKKKIFLKINQDNKNRLSYFLKNL